MQKSMYIGSGDIQNLLRNDFKNSITYHDLLKRFVSGNIPYYNSLNTSIDACRIGAILEKVYYDTLPAGWDFQTEVISKEMDVFRCHLDCAFIGNKFEVLNFNEIKSIEFTKYLELCEICYKAKSLNELIKKKFNTYYNQIQEQLYCTELMICDLTFIPVYNYDDNENMTRDLKNEKLLNIPLFRDEEVISKIKERGSIFQQIKDYYGTVQPK